MPLNSAARQGDDSHERGEIADAGWHGWGPVQRAAVVAPAQRRRRPRRPSSARPFAPPDNNRSRGQDGAHRGHCQCRRVPFRSQVGRNPKLRTRRCGGRAEGGNTRYADEMVAAVVRPTATRQLVLNAYLGERQPACSTAPPTRCTARDTRVRLGGSIPAARAPVGITPATARVLVTDDEMLIRFGPWRLSPPCPTSPTRRSAQCFPSTAWPELQLS